MKSNKKPSFSLPRIEIDWEKVIMTVIGLALTGLAIGVAAMIIVVAVTTAQDHQRTIDHQNLCYQQYGSFDCPTIYRFELDLK